MNRKRIIALLIVCYVLIVALRLTAPFDLDEHDQAKQGLYILDVFQKGSLFLPTERGTIPATKPPLYNWIAAAISLMWGSVTDLTIRIPAALSGLGVVLLTFLVAEMLFSKNVGLYAGLVLILNFHFAKLSCIARTDMMLCFFISLSLYFFLLGSRQRDGGSIYNTLMFVSMGLGSVTKGPVAFFLPALIVLVFLLFMKDLKWLTSVKLVRGIGIWLLMMLGWFIPALIEGGREFFNIVVYDETINRFLGIGTRVRKTRPFYYLFGHFFGKFLPWSLFMPSAIVSYWRSENRDEKHKLLFPVVWFLAVLIFFSISKGKRSDYILPLYPAASTIVAHFWFSLIEGDAPHAWRSHLTTISPLYLLGCLVMIAGLVLLFVGLDLTSPILRISPKSLERMRLLQDTISGRLMPFLLIGLSLAFASILGIALALRRDLKALFVAMFVVAGLYLFMYFHILSSDATTMGGKQKKVFCVKAARRIGSVENLSFYSVSNSILFYMGKNERSLGQDQVLTFFQSTGNRYLITSNSHFLALREQMDSEIVVLEESEYLIAEKRKYVLLGRKNSGV